MKTIELGSLLLFAALALAQQSPTSPSQSSAGNIGEPSLPVIDYKACPFEGCTFGKWKVMKLTAVYSSWQNGRTELVKLQPGEEVIGLTGVHVTRKPDRIVVKKEIIDLGLRPGDVILRYMYVGEGFANIWAKGQWHKEQDCTFITEKSSEGCLRDCSAIVDEEGMKEWWVKIKTFDGKVGWVLEQGNFEGIDSLG
jgi:hypothetical protein